MLLRRALLPLAASSFRLSATLPPRAPSAPPHRGARDACSISGVSVLAPQPQPQRRLLAAAAHGGGGGMAASPGGADAAVVVYVTVPNAETGALAR
jgi:hypothetical protein